MSCLVYMVSVELGRVDGLSARCVEFWLGLKVCFRGGMQLRSTLQCILQLLDMFVSPAFLFPLETVAAYPLRAVWNSAYFTFPSCRHLIFLLFYFDLLVFIFQMFLKVFLCHTFKFSLSYI